MFKISLFTDLISRQSYSIMLVITAIVGLGCRNNDEPVSEVSAVKRETIIVVGMEFAIARKNIEQIGLRPQFDSSASVLPTGHQRYIVGVSINGEALILSVTPGENSIPIVANMFWDKFWEDNFDKPKSERSYEYLQINELDLATTALKSPKKEKAHERPFDTPF